MANWRSGYFDLFGNTERTWLSRIQPAFDRVSEVQKSQAWDLVKGTAQIIRNYQRRQNDAHRGEIIRLELALMDLWSETLYHPGTKNWHWNGRQL